MRTTLDIDDDVLNAARERARREHRTIGQVLSALARQALTGQPMATSKTKGESFYGFAPLPHRGNPVTNELIDRLREEEPE